MTEFKYNKDNIILLIEMRLECLKKQQKGDKLAQGIFEKEVADMAKSGKISKQDIMQLQHEGVDKITIMNISGHLVTGPTGISFHDARDLGHKVQFIALSYAQKNGHDVKMAFGKSHQAMMDSIDEIQEGTYDPTKLAVLQALPSIEKWDHDLGADAYTKIYTV